MTISTRPFSLAVLFTLTACATDDTDDDAGDTGTSETTSDTMPTTAPTTTVSTNPTTVDTTDGEETATTATGTTEAVDTSSSSSSTTSAVLCDPEVIELPGDAFFPEGIHADSQGRLYVGSLTSGEILRITPCQDPSVAHEIEVLNDGADTMAAVGVLVDETSNVLWVCSSDFTGAAPASILGFSLDDGTLMATHAFDAGVCNDLTIDVAGHLYATETFESRIMRVQQQDLLTNSDAEEWSTDTLYQVAPGELGLNGIAFDGASTIYTVNFTSGELYATAIQGNGGAANPTLVDLGGGTLLGPDGLELETETTLLVVENPGRALTRVTLDAGGNMVEVLDNTFDVPTTAVVVGPDVWIVESQLDHLIGMTAPELPFVLVRRTL